MLTPKYVGPVTAGLPTATANVTACPTVPVEGPVFVRTSGGPPPAAPAATTRPAAKTNVYAPQRRTRAIERTPLLDRTWAKRKAAAVRLQRSSYTGADEGRSPGRGRRDPRARGRRRLARTLGAAERRRAAGPDAARPLVARRLARRRAVPARLRVGRVERRRGAADRPGPAGLAVGGGDAGAPG